MSQGTQAKAKPDRRRSGRTLALAVPPDVRLRVSDDDFWRLARKTQICGWNVRPKENCLSCRPQDQTERAT